MGTPIEQNKKAGIKAVYNPTDKEGKERKNVYQRLSDMKASRSKYEPWWDMGMKRWEGYKPPKDLADWQSNIVPPFTTSVVEAELAEIVDQTIRPKVAGRGPEDKPKALVLNKIIDYTWEIGDADLEQFGALKEALICGTAFGQEYYWRDNRDVQFLSKFDAVTGVEEYEKKEVTDFDDVYLEHVSIWDLFFDEAARTINRGPYKANDVIRRYILSKDAFDSIYSGPVMDPLGNAKYVKTGGDTNYYEYYKPPQGISQDQVEVLWYWRRNPDSLIIVANDVVIRMGPNPYNHKQLPFAQAMDVVRPHQLYHKGEPELLESIQEELTTIRRQRLDRTHLDIDKMFLVSNRETLTDQDLIVAPHKPIFVDDPNNSIKALEYAGMNQNAYMEEDRLKEDGERVTGMDVRSQSVRASGSATEAAILKEATLRRLRLKVWLLSRTFLMEVTRLRLSNVMQFYKEDRVKSIVGEDQQLIDQARQSGNIVKVGDQEMMKLPRMIRTNDVQITRDKTTGSISEEDKRGQNFFEVKAEDLIPSHGGFDLVLSAEPTFPVSKPLQQQKVNELFQHPAIISAINAGALDLKKVANKMLEVNDFDPADFEVKDAPSDAIDPQQVIDLAFQEDQQMMQGESIPGTPFAPQEHTQIHLDAMSSKDFTDAFRKNPGIVRAFIEHISTEEAAQGSRQAPPGPMAPGQPGQMTPPGQSVAQGVAASPAQAANGARRVGDTGMGLSAGQVGITK